MSKHRRKFAKLVSAGGLDNLFFHIAESFLNCFLSFFPSFLCFASGYAVRTICSFPAEAGSFPANCRFPPPGWLYPIASAGFYSTCFSQPAMSFSSARLIWTPFSHFTSPLTFLCRAISLLPTPLPPEVTKGMIVLPEKS